METTRAELIVSNNRLRDTYQEVIEEIYEARKYMAKAVDKLNDAERIIRENGGWGCKKL